MNRACSTVKPTTIPMFSKRSESPKVEAPKAEAVTSPLPALPPKGAMEVLYNATYGGFSFSEAALRQYCRKKGLEYNSLTWQQQGRDPDDTSIRTDPVMLEVFHSLGSRASSGQYAELKVKQIPTKYAKHFQIDEYDGYEGVVINYARYKLDKVRAVLAEDREGGSDLKEKVQAALDGSGDEDEYY